MRGEDRRNVTEVARETAPQLSPVKPNGGGGENSIAFSLSAAVSRESGRFNAAPTKRTKRKDYYSPAGGGGGGGGPPSVRYVESVSRNRVIIDPRRNLTSRGPAVANDTAR